jgi:hypothetical protein
MTQGLRRFVAAALALAVTARSALQPLAPRSAGARVVVWALLSAVLGSALPACYADSELLCGRWQSRAAPGGAGSSAASEGGLEAFELYLGHYGPNVVGVIRFYRGEFSDAEGCGTNRAPDAHCCSRYLTNGRWDGRRFTFRIDPTPPSSELPACFPGGDEPPAGDLVGMTFRLDLEGDNQLLGEVSWEALGWSRPVALQRLACETCQDVAKAQRCD